MTVSISECIRIVCLSPIAIFLFMLMILYNLLRFLLKASLLFIIVAINTPFAMMYNVSILVFGYHLPRLARLQKSNPDNVVLNWCTPTVSKSKPADDWNRSDPRVSVGIEVQLLVSDFFKVVAGELLLVGSTGIITYFTAPRTVFYCSTAVWLVAAFHKWLNTDCISKTALSCLCDGYGLSPLMFLFSFIGFFDIGCHPIAKCSFTANRAFLFVKDVPNHGKSSTEQGPKESNIEQGPSRINKKDMAAKFGAYPCFLPPREDDIKVNMEQDPKESNIEHGPSTVNKKIMVQGRAILKFIPPRESHIEVDMEQDDKKLNAIGKSQPFDGNSPPFDGAVSDSDQSKVFKFGKWNAFERVLFQLHPKINFIKRDNGKYILKSFMVLKLLKKHLCEYPVERLELPEDYSEAKANELLNFLLTLSKYKGFVTDKMRGRYEHSLTLLQIVEGVKENDGYRIEIPMDKTFVVAGCVDLQ